MDYENVDLSCKLKGSFLEFTKYFFKYLTRRDFIVSSPVSRESHHIVVCRELTRIFRSKDEGNRLIINLPPGYGKSILVCHWVAWTLAHYPDSNFLYISYSHDLAAKHTAFIKSIVSSPIYGYLFDVKIKKDSRAKDHFVTTQNGTVRGFGSSGSITGSDAGLPAVDRFSGAVIVDDPIKPDAAHSDTIRESVIRNYEETIRQRTRGKKVPIVFIGQRIHESDLSDFLMKGNDTYPWQSVILKSLDEAGNALYPEVHSTEFLEKLQEKSPYVFASQFQQDPLPAGGGLFKPEWIEQLDFYPEMLKTFITVDTAETDKTYNDATAFGFWGIYEIETMGRKAGMLGLHSIDVREIRVDPKDLESEFLDFWQECCLFKVPPMLACIEKKSTGVTMVSTLRSIRGLTIRGINRTSASGSKTERFLRMQPYLAQRLVSINTDARHKELFLTHLSKITANNTHAHDDIADILYDAVDMVYIAKQVKPDAGVEQESSTSKELRDGVLKQIIARRARHGGDWEGFL